MNLLLDTHTLLWFVNRDVNLSVTARRLIEDSQNVKYISMASLWEIAIKVSAGKLEVELPITEFARIHIEENAMVLLPVMPRHLDVVATLPFYHRDRFDRLLVAQSIAEDFIIVTRDSAFIDYAVTRIW